MKISELKESFADWAAGAVSRDSRSVAAGSAAVQKQFMKDFIEDFRNALDSAIKSGLVIINAPKIDTPSTPEPPESEKDWDRLASKYYEDRYNKLNVVFESMMTLIENEGAQTISEWGMDWFSQYMQNYNWNRSKPQVERILKSIEGAYQTQGFKGKIQGAMQFNNSLKQLANLAWSLERTAKLRPGQDPGGDTKGGTTPTPPKSDKDKYAEWLKNLLISSPDPYGSLNRALDSLPPLAQKEVMNIISQRLAATGEINDPNVKDAVEKTSKQMGLHLVYSNPNRK